MMNKYLLAIFLGVLSFGVVAEYCGFASIGKGGLMQQRLRAPMLGFANVELAKTLPNETWVVLDGHIIKRAGYERHEFFDDSGSIYIDIPKHFWGDKVAAPGDRVFIEGEVSKDNELAEINVQSLFIVNEINYLKLLGRQ